MQPAAQYLRMSTDKQRYSIESQAALIAEYAAARGYEVVASYEDAARSGVTIRKRDGLKALLRDVMNGAPFSTILVVDVSRWGRYQDPDQAAHYEFMCREAGVQVRYCAEEFPDDDSPTAALIKSVKRVMAAEYSRQLSDRCRAALRRHMLAGGKGGGHPPYGFSRQIFNGDGSPGGILTVGERRSRYNQTVRLVQGPEEEVRAVRLIFKLFVSQMHGATKIAHNLNAKGIPYRREGPWNYDRVIYVLKNEIAMGVYAFNRTYWRLGRDAVRFPPSEWLRVRVAPPIVSQSTFQAARKKLAELSRGHLTADEMLAQLKALLAKEGRLSSRVIDLSPDVLSSCSYVRRFGSLQAAYDQLGYTPIKEDRRHLPTHLREKGPILENLKLLLDEKGFLSTAEILACPRLPAVKIITRQFGSLDEAYRAVGYNRTPGERVLDGRERGRLDRERLRTK
ncbi:MAG: recombinase family protein [Brevundimonas sp.]|uniref:recombinase family protein n=1 Tax=Brevundimonas sp. TaxID=1871086 RepID=UPI00248802B1|nr:recombinase family protein [Brevundimonas sp.]MDI1328340.1 recombinase family protein [Brevundimonas sp.]